MISVLPKRVIDRIFILGYTNYWKGGVMGFVAKMSRIVAVDADVNLVQALQSERPASKTGRCFWSFRKAPEPSTESSGEFKKGSAILAYELGVPVVPVGLKGAYEMWPRGGRFRRHAVSRSFGGNRLIPNGSLVLRIPMLL